jgi:translation initiation factor IF-3
VPEVRLVGEDGKQIGVIKTADALVYAQERDLDLVEVAPEARPPVCRVLDYSKFKYEQAQKLKAARKHQQQITIREIKFRPKIAQNDYDTKKAHVTRFLLGKDKVKITIMFRGREVTHPERGVALLDKLAGELAEIAVVEQMPLQDGRNMTMMLGPSKHVLAADGHEHPDGEGAGEESATPATEPAPVAAAAAEPAAAVEPAEPAKKAPAKKAAAAKTPKAAEDAVSSEPVAKPAATKATKATATKAAKSSNGSDPAKAETPELLAEKAPAKAAAPKRPRKPQAPPSTGVQLAPPAASVGGGSRPAKRGSASEAED